MAISITHHTPGEGIIIEGGINDRPTYDGDDVAVSPSVTAPGVVMKVCTVTFEIGRAHV